MASGCNPTRMTTSHVNGGLLDDGRPYFVMELVRGASLLEHCERERLGPE